MPIDREATLKKAEKLLRQGRLDAAIAEYVRVVDDNPRDWNTANILGDLYLRAGQHEKAAAQYGRIAEHFVRDGFYSKAAALYKKILKFRPDDEAALLQLGDISGRQGLYADAKAQLSAVAERRRSRGDRRGADQIVVRIGSLDPADFEGRLTAARLMAESGDAAGAAERYRAIAADLFEKNREKDALSALQQAVRLDPQDVAGRTQLARAYLGMGDVTSAREFLDEQTAGADPGLLIALAEVELHEGRVQAAEPVLRRALQFDASLVNEVVNIGWSLCQAAPEAAFLCIDAASDVAIGQADFQTAASILQEYVARATLQIPALLKLVEVCVDGGLETTMYETQAQLCDAYLTAGRAGEARVIAEDLVAREPWDQTHIERFRHALVMLKVTDPDTLIAERLNGQVPFIATDHFVNEPSDDEASSAEAAAAADASGNAGAWGEEPAATPGQPPPSNVEEEDVDIDLTSALGSAESDSAGSSAQPRSLAEVFANARAQAEKQPDVQEAAEQLKLGKAYLDAGLHEEAIVALELAARSPRHRFEAAAALARLYQELNQPAATIEWMERAVESPSPSVEEGRALLYDLGLTLEEQGENARALAVFLELLADAGQYRDARARVGRLSRVETGS